MWRCELMTLTELKQIYSYALRFNTVINEKFVLHALSVFIQRILQWMEECTHEGLMCLWLGPTYPLTMIFKPELAEVRDGSFSRAFTIYLR